MGVGSENIGKMGEGDVELLNGSSPHNHKMKNTTGVNSYLHPHRKNEKRNRGREFVSLYAATTGGGQGIHWYPWEILQVSIAIFAHTGKRETKQGAFVSLYAATSIFLFCIQTYGGGSVKK